MPFVQKQDSGEYLVVSQRDKQKSHARGGRGGPRKSFMVIYTDQKYSAVNGKVKLYAHPHIHLGNLYIRCPEELAGKRVKVRVEVVELPVKPVFIIGRLPLRSTKKRKKRRKQYAIGIKIL